jgi:CRP-like cAMP-binding protein
LDQVPLFQDVSDESKTELAKSLRRRLVEAGAVMVREGDEGDAMFWIARGVVRVTRMNPQSNEPEPLATLLAGDFFGEAGLVTRQPRNASCVAVTPCELYELTRSEFEAFERVAPEAGQAVRKAAQERAAPSTEPSEA